MIRTVISAAVVAALAAPASATTEDRSADRFPSGPEAVQPRKAGDLLAVFRAYEGRGRLPGWPRQWCARGLNYALDKVGISGTGSDMARSFLAWGRPVQAPARGDVVVMSRGRCRTCGHVGVVESVSPGRLRVWSANHGGRFAVADYHPSRVIGYRRAK